MERLELGAGPRRKVFSIELDGETVRTRAGTHGDALKVAERTFASDELARAAFDKDLKARKAKGYKAPPTKALAIGTLSRKGVSARNPEMEALIDEDPDNVESYLVYADWLQGEGDPRGELIGVQASLEKSPKSEKLRDAEAKLLKDYRAELLGPLARYATRRLWDSYTQSFEWFCGFIRKAEFFEARTSVPLERLTSTLVEHPSGRFTKHLILTAEDGGAVLRALPPLPKTLRVLELRGPMMSEPKISLPPDAFAANPHLRRLDLNHATIDFGEGTFDTLRELALSGIPNAGSLLSLSKARFPKLERLEYVYWDHAPNWVQANAALLGSKWENVQTLSVTSRIEPVSLDALLKSRLVGRVRRFELASSWSAGHLTVLLSNASRLTGLEEIVLRSSSGGVPPAKREAVRDALPNVRWA